MNPGAASVLVPAGPAAALSAEVAWVLIGGAALIFVATMTLLVVAAWRGGAADGARPVRDRSRLWIVGGGLVVPVAVLAVLFAYETVRGSALATADPRTVS